MFNKKKLLDLESQITFLHEMNDALLEHLNLDLDFCDCCGDVVLVKKEK
jgi:hypothetical protein